LPYATFVINLSGSFAMGLLMALVLERGLAIAPEVQLLLATGFLGSYTTFSTFELEFVTLLRRSVAWAIAYWAGSAILGAISLYIGILTARLIR
jgi:CrcB protein